MLVLTRRPGERIFIGPNREIEIEVVGIHGNQVRFGLTAPKGVPIHREEIQERIDQERKEGGK